MKYLGRNSHRSCSKLSVPLCRAPLLILWATKVIYSLLLFRATASGISRTNKNIVVIQFEPFSGLTKRR